jgi:putative mRNA 3-end processing factor
MLMSTEHGLYCPAGRFHIDPWRPVERAVITHAHSDHLVWGCGSYLCSTSGRGVLEARLGSVTEQVSGEKADVSAPGTRWKANVESLAFGEARNINGVRVSMHPAGHILGSAQVRVEQAGEVWVVSGDYRFDVDGADSSVRAAEPFEPVRCHTFITESTFGLPIYRWPSDREVFGELNEWWATNAREGRVSVVFAYALGKAQRVLAGLDASIGPVGVHGAVDRFMEIYREQGIRLPPTVRAVGDEVKALKSAGGLVVAPPSAAGSPWLRKFASPNVGVATAMASGWMRVRGARRRRSVDRGFVISDHSDWRGLHAAIELSGAERIGVTHGSVSAMVRWLKEHGREAFGVKTRFEGERLEETDRTGGDETIGESGQIGLDHGAPVVETEPEP